MHVHISQVKAGFVMNILCILVVTMATQTLGMAYFNLTVLPWGNGTSVDNSTLV